MLIRIVGVCNMCVRFSTATSMLERVLSFKIVFEKMSIIKILLNLCC